MSTSGFCLLLGTEFPWRDRALLGAARAFAGPVAVMQASAPLFRNRVADIVIPGDCQAREGALKAVQAFARRTGMRPAAVVPLAEMTIEPGLAIAEHFGLPYLGADAVAAVRDKTIMRRRFQDHGIPVPRFAPFSAFEELEGVADRTGLPLVLKPTNLTGSEGVRLVRERKDLRGAYDFCVGSAQRALRRHGVQTIRCQAEEFIAAPHEISVEVANSPGGRTVIAVTDKFLTEPPYFAEVGHAVPSIHSSSSRVRDAAVDACAALGIDRGVAHVEIRVKADGSPVLIEVNARPGGDGIMDLVERTFGINMFGLHVQSYVGASHVPPPPPPRGRAAIAFLKAPAGRITAVSPPAAKDLPEEVVGLYLQARAGQRSGANVSTQTREGAVEFYWPDDEAREPLTRHLEIARALSRTCFSVSNE